MAKSDLGKLKGQFVGTLKVSFDDDGRLMTLEEPFSYIGADKTEWPVPKGAKTDGASIPRVLWTLIGSPFTDKYRKPAVIHDYYCDVRTQPWRAVHRMFFEGMLTAGVRELDAKILYAGVLYGGPRWNIQAMHNTRLSLKPGLFGGGGGVVTRFAVAPSFDFAAGGAKPGRKVANVKGPELTEERLSQLVEVIGEGDLDPGHLEALVERARKQALA